MPTGFCGSSGGCIACGAVPKPRGFDRPGCYRPMIVFLSCSIAIRPVPPAIVGRRCRVETGPHSAHRCSGGVDGSKSLRKPGENGSVGSRGNELVQPGSTVVRLRPGFREQVPIRLTFFFSKAVLFDAAVVARGLRWHLGVRANRLFKSSAIGIFSGVSQTRTSQ